MQIRILGCSGGVGGNLHTTSMLIDEDILIDAGTGVGGLSLNALQKINHIFITHAHMDHIAYLPLLLDTVMGLRSQAVNVYACAQVVQILKEHVFNWLIWPNFNLIPSRQSPLLAYEVMNVGETVTLAGRMITALPANHSVPAVGYQIDSGNQSLVFTGDTAGCKALWDQVNTIENLKYLIIETAFSNQDAALAAESRHLCPMTLAEELGYLNKKPNIYITHLKPGEGEQIMSEIAEHPKTAHCKVLLNEQVFEF
jgi:ribonuclease BN (tRNA processing enzyme)